MFIMFLYFEVLSLFLVVFLCCFLIFSIVDFICKKKCDSDCSKCKNWLCDYHHCKRKREKLESKLKEQ